VAFRHFIAFFVSAAAVSAALAAPAGGKAIRVLIVTGHDYPAHKWRQTTPVIRKALEETGRFEVRVCEDPEIMSAHIGERYDVVVLHYCDWETSSPSKAALEGLADFVRRGGGLVAIHFASGAFPNWPEYVRLIGRVWDRKSTHDPYGPFRVHVVRKDHPITRGMDDFDTTDELYFCLTGDTPIEVLLTAHSKVKDREEPMGFVLRYGKGRVFHTPLGHDVRALSSPGVVRLLRRACEWAATGDVKE